MVKLKYKHKRDLPNFVRKYKTFSPTRLREVILKEGNELRTPESITLSAHSLHE